MTKQKLRLSFGFLLFFTGFTVGAVPLQAYAGSDVVRGTSVESSTFSGDTFNEQVDVPSPNTVVSPEINSEIRITQQAQEDLNNIASNIVKLASSCADSSAAGCAEIPIATILNVLVQASTDSQEFNNFQTSLSSAGVPENLITSLVNSLSGLLQGFSTTIQATEQVNSTGDTQTEQQASVDVNQFRAAINAYNQIILTSNAQTLQNLSKNSDFLRIGRVLKDLRVGLNAQ